MKSANNPAFVSILLFLMLAFSATHEAAEAPASQFNIPGQARTRDCVALKNQTAPLRHADGTPTGWVVSRDDPSKLGGRHTPCATGTAEMDLHEVLTNASGMRLWFHAGGGGSLYKDPVQYGQYGHIAEEDLASKPAAAGSINGKAAALSGTRYLITPTRIPRAMWYKPNVSNGHSGSTYYTYGNPGYDKTGGIGDWTYINWSWVQNGKPTYPESRCAGGGMVRALGKRNTSFDACLVELIPGYSYGADNRTNGRVTVIYGRTYAGPGAKGSEIYGWTPLSYQRNGDIIVPCLRRAKAGESSGDRCSSIDPMERMAWNLAHPCASNQKQREQLVQAFRNGSTRLQKFGVASELARMDDAETVSALLDLLEGESDSMAREQLVALTCFMASASSRIEPISAAFAKVYDRSAVSRERGQILDSISNIPSIASARFVEDAWQKKAGSAEERGMIADAVNKLGNQGVIRKDVHEEALKFIRVRAKQTRGVDMSEES